MRLLLVTAGSRGDVEPFAALARRARAIGHEATLIAPRNSGVDPDGIELVELEADYSAVVRTQGSSGWAAMRSFRTVVRPIMHEVLIGPARWALDNRADVVVAHPKVLSAGLIARHWGVPFVRAELVPALCPTRAFPAPGTFSRSRGGILNRATYAAAGAAGAMFAADLREAAAVLRVPRRLPDPARSLVAVSEHILARPADWPESTVLTGAWDDPVRREAVPRIEEFVSGGPFVYAGFGSMADARALEHGEALVAGARALGMRILIATGLGGIAVADRLRGPDVLVEESIDHARVLPRASVAVHHGGIGTVHAVVRAGIPSVVVPFTADQPFWAAVLEREGLSAPAIPPSRLTAARAERALSHALGCAETAQSRGRLVAAEDGVGRALDEIQRTAGM